MQNFWFVFRCNVLAIVCYWKVKIFSKWSCIADSVWWCKLSPLLVQKKKNKNKNKNKEKKKEMRFSLDDMRECKALCAEYFFLLWHWSLGWAVSTLISSFQNWMHRVLVVLLLFGMSLCSTNVLFSPNSLHPFRKYPFSQTNSSSSIFFSRIGKATICTC